MFDPPSVKPVLQITKIVICKIGIWHQDKQLNLVHACRFINIVEFADPESEVPSSQSQKLMLKSVSRATPATEVWAGLSVVDFEKTPPSRYSMLPATKRYEYYKHYGFAGKGAKTSWAHNPTKKPVRLPCHGVWPEQLQDV